MRALVVDDARTVRAILSSILQDAEFEVIQAEDGQDALVRLEEAGPVDLMLIDWNMPRMNGLEFVQAVRANEAHKDARLIMVTTEAEMDRVVEALEAGADEYVMKPFTREVILDKLRMLGLAEV